MKWGCFGFDSKLNRNVSMSGVALVARKSHHASHNWRKQLCTRCVVCQAHYLNPAGQGYRYDEYPAGAFRSLTSGIWGINH
jgi:hypothetical protein